MWSSRWGWRKKAPRPPVDGGGGGVGTGRGGRNTATIHCNRICRIGDDLDWSNGGGGDGAAWPWPSSHPIRPLPPQPPQRYQNTKNSFFNSKQTKSSRAKNSTHFEPVGKIDEGAKRVVSSSPALGFAMRCSPSRLWRICGIVGDGCPSLYPYREA